MTIRQIAQKYQLHLDQTGVLEDETSAVMLGFTDTADFQAVLAETMGIDSTKADAIARDLNDLLFIKIREVMKKTYQKQKVVPSPAQVTRPAIAPASVKISTPVPPIVPPAQPKLPPVPAPLPPKPMVPAPKIITPHPADMILTQKTVSTAPAQITNPSPAAPIAPKPYTADPYREPAE